MCVQKNAESVYLDSASIQNLADDFAHVFRQAFLRPNALQFLFHQVFAVRFELVAEVERLHQAGGDLWVKVLFSGKRCFFLPFCLGFYNFQKTKERGYFHYFFYFKACCG